MDRISRLNNITAVWVQRNHAILRTMNDVSIFGEWQRALYNLWHGSWWDTQDARYTVVYTELRALWSSGNMKFCEPLRWFLSIMHSLTNILSCLICFHLISLCFAMIRLCLSNFAINWADSVSWCMWYTRMKVTENAFVWKWRCAFVHGEPLNHIHQDTKSARLIAVCKRRFSKRVFKMADGLSTGHQGPFIIYTIGWGGIKWGGRAIQCSPCPMWGPLSLLQPWERGGGL